MHKYTFFVYSQIKEEKEDGNHQPEYEFNRAMHFVNDFDITLPEGHGGNVNLKDVELAKEFLILNGEYPTTILPNEMWSEEEAEKRETGKKEKRKAERREKMYREIDEKRRKKEKRKAEQIEI